MIEDKPSNPTNTSQVCVLSASRTFAVRFNDFPSEIRSQILEEFLPPRKSVLKTTLRSHQQTNLQLPAESKQTLVSLLLVSKSMHADLVTLILSRCLVSINHDSSHNSVKLLEESSFLNLPTSRFGFACLRNVEVKWAPETTWDAAEVERFCGLLAKATGLVELKLTIPTNWWKTGAVEIWKGCLRRMLTSSPNLSAIRLEKYQVTTNCHPGWRMSNSSRLHTYRDGDAQWLEMEDS